MHFFNRAISTAIKTFKISMKKITAQYLRARLLIWCAPRIFENENPQIVNGNLNENPSKFEFLQNFKFQSSNRNFKTPKSSKPPKLKYLFMLKFSHQTLFSLHGSTRHCSLQSISNKMYVPTSNSFDFHSDFLERERV